MINGKLRISLPQAQNCDDIKRDPWKALNCALDLHFISSGISFKKYFIGHLVSIFCNKS